MPKIIVRQTNENKMAKKNRKKVIQNLPLFHSILHNLKFKERIDQQLKKEKGEKRPITMSFAFAHSSLKWTMKIGAVWKAEIYV